MRDINFKVTFVPEEHAPNQSMKMRVKTFARPAAFVFDKSMATDDFEAIYLKPYLDLLTELDPNNAVNTYSLERWELLDYGAKTALPST